MPQNGFGMQSVVDEAYCAGVLKICEVTVRQGDAACMSGGVFYSLWLQVWFAYKSFRE